MGFRRLSKWNLAKFKDLENKEWPEGPFYDLSDFWPFCPPFPPFS